MPAQIGTNDSHLFEHSNEPLLREVSGLTPEPEGVHVLLEPLGVESTQRLALGEVEGSVVAGLWPGELQKQARYLYIQGRGSALVNAAQRLGWTVAARPHLGFRNSSSDQRLYLEPDPDVTIETYVRNWELGDLARVKEYPQDDVRSDLWKWLKRQRYATDEDDAALETFFELLGKRRAQLRPGLQLLQRWEPADDVAPAIRRAVNGVLGAAGDKPMPGA